MTQENNYYDGELYFPPHLLTMTTALTLCTNTHNIEILQGLKIVTVASLNTLTDTVCTQVDYICLRDVEGQQMWFDNNQQSIVEKSIAFSHSLQLSQIDSLIRERYEMDQKMKKNRKLATTISIPLHVSLDSAALQALGKKYDKSDISQQKQREEDTLDTQRRRVLRN